MSGLVERVREKVLGGDTTSQDTHRTTDSLNSRTRDHRASYDPARESNTDRISSPTVSTRHIHQGANPQDSRELIDTPFPQPPTMSNYRNSDYTTSRPDQALPQDHRYGRNTTSNEMNRTSTGDYTEEVPARSSSLQYHQPHAVTTDTAQHLDQRGLGASGQGPVPYPYTVPRRKESLSQSRSLPRNSHERNRSGQYHNEMQGGSTVADGSTNLPLNISGGNLGTEVDQALARLSIDEENHRGTAYPGQSATRSGQHGNVASEHLRLPEGFNLNHKESTTIDTEWKPAITHETIRPQRTEIVQEAITRDIHIHHYYTYVQPIAVVEVLPAKHYRFDESTGVKTEIPEPTGWRMPQNLQPRTPDLTTIKGYERHYLVNEEFPRGTPEPPPTTRRRDYSSKDYVNGSAARV